MTAIASVFCGGWWLMYSNDVFLLFPIVFGLVGLLFAFVSLDLWLYRSVVQGSRRGLDVRGGWFGIGRTHHIATDDVVNFATKQSMATEKAVWSNISVVANGGKEFTIGKGIRSKLAQKAVIDELNAAMERS